MQFNGDIEIMPGASRYPQATRLTAGQNWSFLLMTMLYVGASKVKNSHSPGVIMKDIS